MEGNSQGVMVTPCKVTTCPSLLPQPKVSSHPTCHSTCWYGMKGTKVDQSCFKSYTRLKSISLKYAPSREFAEEIHDYGEHCKY